MNQQLVGSFSTSSVGNRLLLLVLVGTLLLHKFDFHILQFLSLEVGGEEEFLEDFSNQVFCFDYFIAGLSIHVLEYLSCEFDQANKD